MKLLLKKQKTKTVKEDKHLHLCTGETLAVHFLEENRLITEARGNTEIPNFIMSARTAENANSHKLIKIPKLCRSLTMYLKSFY